MKARFVSLSNGKFDLGAKEFFGRFILKREQKCLAFQLRDKERGVYPVFLDIDLDYMGKCTLDEDLQREKHISTANFIVGAMRKQFPQLGDVEIMMSKRQAYFKGKKKVRSHGTASTYGHPLSKYRFRSCLCKSSSRVHLPM